MSDHNVWGSPRVSSDGEADTKKGDKICLKKNGFGEQDLHPCIPRTARAVPVLLGTTGPWDQQTSPPGTVSSKVSHTKTFGKKQGTTASTPRTRGYQKEGGLNSLDPKTPRPSLSFLAPGRYKVRAQVGRQNLGLNCESKKRI